MRTGNIMRVLQIDNPHLLASTQCVKKGSKIILLERDNKIINIKGSCLPHLKTRTGIELKYCTDCKNWLNIVVFIKHKYGNDGLKNICRDCDNKRRRKRYAERASTDKEKGRNNYDK